SGTSMIRLTRLVNKLNSSESHKLAQRLNQIPPSLSKQIPQFSPMETNTNSHEFEEASIKSIPQTLQNTNLQSFAETHEDDVSERFETEGFGGDDDDDDDEGRRRLVPEELSKSVVMLECESSAEGGSCVVYLVGTAHVSTESCREVKAVISYLKPQVVFLELCSSRVGILTPQNVQGSKYRDCYSLTIYCNGASPTQHPLFLITDCIISSGGIDWVSGFIVSLLGEGVSLSRVIIGIFLGAAVKVGGADDVSHEALGLNVAEYKERVVEMLSLIEGNEKIELTQALRVENGTREVISTRAVVDSSEDDIGDSSDEVATKLEVFPGSEFRVAYEEAMKYGGKVILGDRPVQITLRRTWGKLSLWHKVKFLKSMLFEGLFLPSPEEINKMMKEMSDVDMLTFVIQEMGKAFPTLIETLLYERDMYMSSTLLRVASEHNSVVAVVGKGHLQGIKKHWKQPVEMKNLLEMPARKPRVTAVKLFTSFGVVVAGAAIISGIYFASK
ncbi:hypothetical protein GIB67_032224, partial [Kingdonia uniflora]